MKHIVVFCEGATEQGFCKHVLQQHLFPDGVGDIQTLAVGKRGAGHVYGVQKYAILKTFIQRTRKARHGGTWRFTTLVDLYGLPKDFPSGSGAPRDSGDPAAYARALEEAFGRDIGDRRFLPHLQLHEFETMLFADPGAFAASFENCGEAIGKLRQVADSAPTLEHINDDPETAPSKRIIQLIPAYEGRKTSAGPEIAARIGIPAIRAQCPHFDLWISQLERWRGEPAGQPEWGTE
ncbi:DUF4276 family protein [Candidatus Poribacteria bacterium]|nr:DUF4276 family protein [Candidatus Poribacteria bacterium]